MLVLWMVCIFKSKWYIQARYIYLIKLACRILCVCVLILIRQPRMVIVKGTTNLRRLKECLLLRWISCCFYYDDVFFFFFCFYLLWHIYVSVACDIPRMWLWLRSLNFTVCGTLCVSFSLCIFVLCVSFSPCIFVYWLSEDSHSQNWIYKLAFQLLLCF